MPAILTKSGYSGTPLVTKLGLKGGMSAAFIALPAPLEALASSVDFAVVDRAGDWAGIAGEERKYDFIHAFTRQHAEIAENLDALQDALKADGMIWVSWPKKVSKVATDVTEDVVRAEALALDLVDVKIAAIDEVWSGLKLVIRKERRR